MSFCKINGMTIPCPVGAPSLSVEIRESGGRSFDGGLLHRAHSRKDYWELQTAPLLYEVARCLLLLLKGEGHSWSFEDVTDWGYSSRGLAIEAAEEAERSLEAPLGFPASLKVEHSAVSHNVTWEVGSFDEWTILAWVRVDAGDWEHHARRNDKQFVDGGEGVADRFLYDDPHLVLLDPADGEEVYFSDLVFLPFALDEGMIGQLHEYASPFSPLPYLHLSGEIVGEREKLVAGVEPWSVGYRTGRHLDSEMHHSNLQIIRALLREV